MELVRLQCCGMQEIKELRTEFSNEVKEKEAKGAMKAFLQFFYGPGWTDFDKQKWSTGNAIRWTRVPAFVVFSGVLSTHYTLANMNAAVKKGYAQAFAKLIQDEELGELTTLEPQRNRVNHPQHNIQAYLWHPDIDALKRWIRRNKISFRKKKTQE